MIFGSKYRHILPTLTILRYAVKQRDSLGFSTDNQSRSWHTIII